MKKFLKTSLMIALTIFCASCDKIAEEEVEDTGFFYDVVYQTVATRQTSNHSWVNVQGVMQMKFTQNTGEQGTFAFYYANYKEPQFVFNICSGGFKGNFTLLDEQESSNCTEGPYDIMCPYGDGSSSNSGGESTVEGPLDPNDTDTPQKITAYQFQLEITARNLDPACRPESNRNVLLYRFVSGEIVIKSEYRELRMRPVLTSESQIN